MLQNIIGVFKGRWQTEMRSLMVGAYFTQQIQIPLMDSTLASISTAKKHAPQNLIGVFKGHWQTEMRSLMVGAHFTQQIQIPLMDSTLDQRVTLCKHFHCQKTCSPESHRCF